MEFYYNFIYVFLVTIHITLTNQTQLFDNGYIVFCPCMGRFGNQADHFLGALGFAKGLNRTLVLPHWVEYRYGEPKSIQIPFNTYFQVEPLLKYHDVILMNDFMEHHAPRIWPAEKRTVFCYMPRGDNNSCNAKDGNPFGSFWDTFNVDFIGSEFYGPLHYDIYYSNIAEQWNKKYHPSKWPVLAFIGAPAAFPVQKENINLHKYLKWSSYVENLAIDFIEKTLPRGAFIGIHLRNGADWVRACEHVRDTSMLFSSPQCFGYHNEYGPVTSESCFPTKDIIIRHLRRALRHTKDVNAIFVASDNNHMLDDIRIEFKELKVEKYPENFPHVDLAILGRANHFIGNCVSSYSAFVKRERDVNGFPSSFWAFPPSLKNEWHDEL